MDNSIPSRTCASCGLVHPETTEFFAKRDPSKRTPSARFYPVCKACQSSQKQDAPRGYKTCRQCGVTCPKTAEFFRTNGVPTLFKPVCKTCLNNPPKAPVANGMKRCAKCGAEKPATTNHFHMNKQKGTLRGKCKPCMHAETLAHTHENVEQVRYTRRLAYHRNPTKYRLKSTTRNRKKTATGKVTTKDVALKLQQQKRKCYWCGTKLIGNAFQIDHIIPISKDGPHTPGNICCACSHCNLSKSAKMPYEFAGRLF